MKLDYQVWNILLFWKPHLRNCSRPTVASRPKWPWARGWWSSTSAMLLSSSRKSFIINEKSPVIFKKAAQNKAFIIMGWDAINYDQGFITRGQIGWSPYPERPSIDFLKVLVLRSFCVLDPERRHPPHSFLPRCPPFGAKWRNSNLRGDGRAAVSVLFLTPQAISFSLWRFLTNSW